MACLCGISDLEHSFGPKIFDQMPKNWIFGRNSHARSGFGINIESCDLFADD